MLMILRKYTSLYLKNQQRKHERDRETDNEGKAVKEETEIIREGQTVRDRDSGYQFHIKQFNDVLIFFYFVIIFLRKTKIQNLGPLASQN